MVSYLFVSGIGIDTHSLSGTACVRHRVSYLLYAVTVILTKLIGSLPFLHATCMAVKSFIGAISSPGHSQVVKDMYSCLLKVISIRDRALEKLVT